jgi:hypothetical protein
MGKTAGTEAPIEAIQLGDSPPEQETGATVYPIDFNGDASDLPQPLRLNISAKVAIMLIINQLQRVEKPLGVLGVSQIKSTLLNFRLGNTDVRKTEKNLNYQRQNVIWNQLDMPTWGARPKPECPLESTDRGLHPKARMSFRINREVSAQIHPKARMSFRINRVISAQTHFFVAPLRYNSTHSLSTAYNRTRLATQRMSADGRANDLRAL